MSPVTWIIIFLLTCLILKRKALQSWINSAIHIYKHVTILPGPKAVPLFGNSLSFTWDTVEFTYQMEYYFRKHAFKLEEGLLRFWLGPVPIVFLTRPASVKAVLESPTLTSKPPEYNLLRPIWGDGLITSSGMKWHTRRKMLTPAFHLTVLQNYLKTFNSQSTIMVKILDELSEKNEPFDLLPILRRFSIDTITEAAMGVQINAQKGENQEFYHAVSRVFDLIFKNLRYPWLWFTPIWYALGYGREFDKYASIITKLTRKVVLNRKAEFENMKENPSFDELSTRKKSRQSFLDLLLSMQEEHKLTVADISEEVGTIFVAGYDTVSSSIGFALFLLGHRPEYQQKVYDELQEVFGGDEREITMEDLKKLRYLEQCMKETLRLYPTIVMIGRLITEDIRVGNYIIPAGVTACVSPFSVARDPTQWENPEIFDPDRFTNENVAKRDPFAFIPFSAGIRNCLGQKFALMEEKVALAYILRRYEVTSMISEEENRGLPEITLKPSRGFPIRLTRRRQR